MQTFTFDVTQRVKVTIDDEKFTPEFISEFRKHFSPLYDVDGHAEHLALLHVRGVADDDSFIEGYGPAADMGIKFEIESEDIETVMGGEQRRRKL